MVKNFFLQKNFLLNFFLPKEKTMKLVLVIATLLTAYVVKAGDDYAYQQERRDLLDHNNYGDVHSYDDQSYNSYSLSDWYNAFFGSDEVDSYESITRCRSGTYIYCCSTKSIKLLSPKSKCLLLRKWMREKMHSYQINFFKYIFLNFF